MVLDRCVRYDLGHLEIDAVQMFVYGYGYKELDMNAMLAVRVVEGSPKEFQGMLVFFRQPAATSR